MSLSWLDQEGVSSRTLSDPVCHVTCGCVWGKGGTLKSPIVALFGRFLVIVNRVAMVSRFLTIALAIHGASAPLAYAEDAARYPAPKGFILMTHLCDHSRAMNTLLLSHDVTLRTIDVAPVRQRRS